MISFEEYRRHDALGLAGLVKNGEVTPLELLETAIARAEQVNPQLNAVVCKLYDEAKVAAVNVDRSALFAGVPFLVKDLGMAVKGAPLTYGCKSLAKRVPAEDSWAVVKMREAGLVIMGKTNTPEFGLTPFTEPEVFGPTRNPWDTGRTAGGSSGGSGSAVAAGIVPMATANDGGGSIRIPASCNGLFGMKPSRGRVSWYPLYGTMWNGAAIEGCVSRSVRDTAAYLDTIQGSVPGDPYFIQPPVRPYQQEVNTLPGKLKIAYSTGHTVGGTVDNACLKGTEAAVALLRSEGHTVEEVALPYTREDLTEAFLVVVAGEVAADLAMLGTYLGRKTGPSDVEANTYALGLLGKYFSAGHFAVAKSKWEEMSRRMADFHRQYDVFLTPTVARPPFPIGEMQNSRLEDFMVNLINRFGWGWAMNAGIGKLADKVYGYMPWTAFANITGQPSMSVPLYWTEQNLPVGMMFTGRLGEEDLLFRLAGQLEQAAPWFQRTPRL